MRPRRIIKLTLILLLLAIMPTYLVARAAYRTHVLKTPELRNSYIAQGERLKAPLIEFYQKSGRWPDKYSDTGHSLPWTLIGQWRYKKVGASYCSYLLEVGGDGMPMSGFTLSWWPENDPTFNAGCSELCSEKGWDIAD